jgi:hypothetical protein
MDLLTIQQKILVLSNTINMIEKQYARDPEDVELRARCIKIRQHLLDHLYENNPPLLATCNHCLSDYREDLSIPPDAQEMKDI